MKIEQCLYGRKRFNGYPIGSNGDVNAGFGCYCRTDDVDRQDILDLANSFGYYVCRERRKDDSEPTILSKTRLQSGNVALTALTALHSEGDRPNVISHSYIIPVSHSQNINPESWFGIPYYRHDINAMSPAEEAARQKAGKQIILRGQDLLPANEFQLKPLSQVMKIWNLSMPMLLGLLEGIVDAVRLKHHSVYITYDIDKTTEEDMEQLLAWLFLMLPYSFRRLTGYDTLLNGSSSRHQIIFVASQQLIPGSELRIRSWKSDGTTVQEHRLYLERAYLYDSEKGTILHYPSQGEVFGQNTPFTRCLAKEIETLSKLETIQQCRLGMKQFDDLFRDLDEVLNIFETSIELYDTELYFREDLESESIEELKTIAYSLISDPDLPQSETTQGRLKIVTDILEKKKEDPDADDLYRTVIWKAVEAEEYPSQIKYTKKLASILLGSPAGQRTSNLKEVQKRLEGKTIQGVSTGDLVQWEMLKDPVYRQEYIRESFSGLTEWKGRVSLSRQFIDYFQKALPRDYESVLQYMSEVIWNKDNMPHPSDKESLIYLLNYKDDRNGNQKNDLTNLIYTVLEAFEKYIGETEACKSIINEGIRGFYSYYDSTKLTFYPGFDRINQGLFAALHGKWLPVAGRQLVSEPQQVLLTLSAPGKMRVIVPGNGYLVDDVFSSVANYVNWDFMKEMLKQYADYPQIEAELDDLELRIMKKVSDRPINRGQTVSADVFAEAVAADVMYEGCSNQQGNGDRLIAVIGKNPDVTLSYLNDFADRINFITGKELPELNIFNSQEECDLFARDIRYRGCHTVDALLSPILEKVYMNPRKSDLKLLDHLAAAFEGVNEVTSFSGRRADLVERLNLYPSFDELFAYMSGSDPESRRILTDCGFIDPNESRADGDTRQLVLNQIVTSSPGNLSTLFDDILMNFSLRREVDYQMIYDRTCEGLLKDFCHAERKPMVDKRWLELRDYSRINKLRGCGDYAGALACLYSIYQNKKINVQELSSGTIKILIECYISGKINVIDNYEIAGQLLVSDSHGDFSDRIVMMEAPEKIIAFKAYLDDSEAFGLADKLDRSIKKYEVSFAEADLDMFGQHFTSLKPVTSVKNIQRAEVRQSGNYEKERSGGFLSGISKKKKEPETVQSRRRQSDAQNGSTERGNRSHNSGKSATGSEKNNGDNKRRYNSSKTSGNRRRKR